MAEKPQQTCINEDIKAQRVILISSDGTNKGEIAFSTALAEAKAQDLDLVEVSAADDRTICRIMDYGKQLFDNKKKRKQNSGQSKSKNEIKEVRLRPAIEVNDLMTKSKQARKFLLAGKRVKLDVRLKGRERRHPEMATEVADRFFKTLEDVAKMEVKGNSYLLIPTGI